MPLGMRAKEDHTFGTDRMKLRSRAEAIAKSLAKNQMSRPVYACTFHPRSASAFITRLAASVVSFNGGQLHLSEICKTNTSTGICEITCFLIVISWNAYCIQNFILDIFRKEGKRKVLGGLSSITPEKHYTNQITYILFASERTSRSSFLQRLLEVSKLPCTSLSSYNIDWFSEAQVDYNNDAQIQKYNINS